MRKGNNILENIHIFRLYNLLIKKNFNFLEVESLFVFVSKKENEINIF